MSLSVLTSCMTTPCSLVGLPSADHSKGRFHATLSQRQSSGIVGRLPYDRMPTRKILPVTQKKTRIVAKETAIEVATCQSGGSLTSVRTNIVIGPHTGASEKPTASFESGFMMIGIMR